LEYDKAYEFCIKGQVRLGNLSEAETLELLADGRVASLFLEKQLTKWFPQLKHITGCKDHDHIMELQTNTGTTIIKFDQKSFTRSGGCRFMPSYMIGAGRKFDEESFRAHAKNISYIICDITRLPAMKVVFKRGPDLIERYPRGIISKTHRSRSELFYE